MARRIRPLKWFRLNAYDGEPVRFFLSHDTITDELRKKPPLKGVCIENRRTILVNVRYPSHTFPETVVHELIHHSLGPIGLPYWLEEQILSGPEAGYIGFDYWPDSALIRLLTQLDLKLPPLPRGYAELCAATKRRRKRKK